MAGAGNGFVDAFDTGRPISFSASRRGNELNAPWGLAWAPTGSANSAATCSSATSAMARSTRSTPARTGAAASIGRPAPRDQRRPPQHRRPVGAGVRHRVGPSGPRRPCSSRRAPRTSARALRLADRWTSVRSLRTTMPKAPTPSRPTPGLQIRGCRLEQRRHPRIYIPARHSRAGRRPGQALAI